jgi:hypothetical protein
VNDLEKYSQKLRRKQREWLGVSGTWQEKSVTVVKRPGKLKRERFPSLPLHHTTD